MESRGAYRTLAVWNSALRPTSSQWFGRRVLLNLREAFHFCELRSAANAHFSIRRLALQLAETLRETYPLLAPYLRLPDESEWKKLEAEHFTQV
jgi:hypothetical protein